MSIISFGADDKDDEDDDERNHIIKLTSIKMQKKLDFKLWKEDELPWVTKQHKKTGNRILDFDMSKLEMEYDYDTDKE